MHRRDDIEVRKTAASRLLVLALVFGVLVAPWTASTGSTEDRGDFQQPDLRVELSAMVDRLLELDHPMIDAAAAEALEEVRLRLDTMSDAELFELEAVAPQMHQMNIAFRKMSAVAQRRVQRVRSRNSGFEGEEWDPSTRVPEKSAGLPTAAYPNLADDVGAAVDADGGTSDDGEVDAPSQNSVTEGGNCDAVNRSTTLEAYALRTAFIVIEAARDVADRLCAQSIGGLLVGGNASVLCIPMDFVYIVGKSLHDNLAMCDDFIDAAEIEGSYERIGHLHADLETGQASLTNLDGDLVAHGAALASHHTNITDKIILNRNTITTAIGASGTTIVTAIGTHDSSIKALLAANQAFFTRLEIEEALLNQEREAVFYLPAAEGGNLELSRDIVDETIMNVASSGESVHDATDELADADALIGSGRYKKAFNALGAAYFEAIKKDRKENQPSTNSIP